MFLSSSFAACGLCRLSTIVWFFGLAVTFSSMGDSNGKAYSIRHTSNQIKSNHDRQYDAKLES